MTQKPETIDIDPNGTVSVCNVLQQDLVDLLVLSLQLKQAHWNVQGPQFRQVHLHLDEILDGVRIMTDDLAERIAALGRHPDGRPATLAKDTTLDTLPEGKIAADEAIELISSQMAACVNQLRDKLSVLGKADPVSEDLVIGALATLEKQHWLLRSQRS